MDQDHDRATAQAGRRSLLRLATGAGLALPLLGLGGLFAPALARAVNAIRLTEQDGGTRLALALDVPFDWELFTLGGPDRLVLDMTGITWRTVHEAPGQGLVRRARYGLFRPRVSRLVLDLAGPVAVREAGFAPAPRGRGHQFVLALEPGARARFLALRLSGRAAAGTTVARRTPRRGEAQAAEPERRPARVQPVIVLDPGHGGIDPGAIGVSGTHEKHVTLLAARELKRQLDATRRYQVHLTRTGDRFVSLRERVAMAERLGAHLFVSIHADAIDDAAIRGASVYTLSERASDTMAAAIARQENRSDERAGLHFPDVTPEVARILASLVRRETMNQSARAARKAVEELARTVPMLPRSHRSASFVVLKSVEVPSMLVELGFMSNRRDEALLRRADHRRRVAAAVKRAVDRHFEGMELPARPPGQAT